MYKKMYLILFKAITETLKNKNAEEIRTILKQALIDAEEVCMSSDEEI